LGIPPEFFPYLRSYVNRFFLDFAFPKTKHFPSIFEECSAVFHVTVHIAIKLRGPVFRVRLWTHGLITPRMLMPKATVNKDNSTVFGKDNIGTAGKFLTVDSKAKPHTV
jgi:hypothetical protein